MILGQEFRQEVEFKDSADFLPGYYEGEAGEFSLRYLRRLQPQTPYVVNMTREEVSEAPLPILARIGPCVFLRQEFVRTADEHLAIVAHEVGHIECGHTRMKGVSEEDRVPLEIEADWFAAVAVGPEPVFRSLVEAAFLQSGCLPVYITEAVRLGDVEWLLEKTSDNSLTQRLLALGKHMQLRLHRLKSPGFHRKI